MLNVKSRMTAKGGKEALSYYSEHLSQEHYYAEKDSTVGVWFGKTAELLGLNPGTKVNGETFTTLVNGESPSGERLTLRHKSNRIAYYDIVLSAPKAVSILAILGQDDRLITAHEEAACETMRYAESFIETRVRRGIFAKSNKTRIAGNIIAASFLHKTSRALDPQLHTHFITLNVTRDSIEKKYKALYARSFYDGYELYLQVYRNALAKRMRNLGYEVDKSGKLFRVNGISADLERRFSKRSRQILELEEELKEKGLTLSNDGRAILAQMTRAKKKVLRPEELQQLQQEQLSATELLELAQLVERTKQKPITLQVNVSGQALKSSKLIELAVKNVLERVTVASEQQILTKALEFCSDGEASIEELKKELRSDKYIVIEGMITTKEAQRREANLIRFASQKWSGAPLPLGNKKGLVGLSFTQKIAAGTVLASRDRVVLLRGLAGTGKTTTLSEIIRNLNLPGDALTYVVAPSTSAVETLKQELLERLPDELLERRTKVQTMQRLLISTPDQLMLKNGVLIVDEAGLASSKDIEKLFIIAKDQNCRVVLVGDHKQHQSVSAGDAFRILMKHATCTKATLWKIHRQSNEYKEVVRAIDKGNIKKSWELLARGWNVPGFEDSSNKSLLTQIPEAESRAKQVCAQYLKVTDLMIEGRKQTALIVTPTWKEHERVCNAMRQSLKEIGRVEQEDHKMQILRSLTLTDEEKKNHGYYSCGQVLLVHRRARSLKKNDQLTVMEIDGKYLKVQKQDGKVFRINPQKVGVNCEVMQKVEQDFSTGDQIMLQANFVRGRTRLANGSVHKIVGIRDNGEIVLEKDHVLPASFRTFTHGYATTSHKSQSKTVDYAILSVDSHQKKALSSRQWLVSLSRGRKAAFVYSNDLNKLFEASHINSDRKSALELLEQSVHGQTAIGKLKKLIKRLPSARDWLSHRKDSQKLRDAGRTLERDSDD